MFKYIRLSWIPLLTILIIASCSDTAVQSTEQISNSPALNQSEISGTLSALDIRNLDPNSILDINSMNGKLSASGSAVRIAYAETVTGTGGPTVQAGQTIFANDRTLQLTAQWVPEDPRRPGSTNNLTHIHFEPFGIANFGTSIALNGIPSIDASFDTWNDLKVNSKVEVEKLPPTSENPSVILGGNPFLADISTTGFLPGFLFDLVLGPGASESVLGVTFTLIWVNPATGVPTDINNDGYNDVALKEVWYNDAFDWTDTGDGSQGVDIETVALHENGHALGLGHFGKISITGTTPENTRLHVAPRAVMNAFILGTQRDLLGTDEASYNTLYGDWPLD